MTQPTPVDLVIDCRDGSTTARALSPDEAAQRAAEAQQAQQDQPLLGDEARQEMLDRIQARAAQDQDFAALAHLAGVLPPPR